MCTKIDTIVDVDFDVLFKVDNSWKVKIPGGILTIKASRLMPDDKLLFVDNNKVIGRIENIGANDE